MKRIISFILCVLLLASLCACQKAEPTPAPTEAPAATAAPTAPAEQPGPTQEPISAPAGIGSYADAYLLYRSICTAMQEEVGRRLDVHNAVLEKDNPEGFFMDPAYLILVYMPFHTSGPTVGSALAEPQTDIAGVQVIQLFQYGCSAFRIVAVV